MKDLLAFLFGRGGRAAAEPAPVPPVAKPYPEMTLAELRAERARWDARIRETTRWGRDTRFAVECRRACQRWIRVREDEAACGKAGGMGPPAVGGGRP